MASHKSVSKSQLILSREIGNYSYSIIGIISFETTETFYACNLTLQRATGNMVNYTYNILY